MRCHRYAAAPACSHLLASRHRPTSAARCPSGEGRLAHNVLSSLSLPSSCFCLQFVFGVSCRRRVGRGRTGSYPKHAAKVRANGQVGDRLLQYSSLLQQNKEGGFRKVSSRAPLSVSVVEQLSLKKKDRIAHLSVRRHLYGTRAG